MNAASETQPFVDDVVIALIGTSATGERDLDVPAQVDRARRDIDASTAESFGSALVGSLCDDSSNLDLLEALIVLGMAHPQVARRHRFDLLTETKRYATLLERTGDAERARHVLEALADHLPDERSIDHELAGIMRRNGDVDELIDRYLARADEAVAKRRPLDAIPWLQEVLLLDRSRRDVARMIRDLRYSEEEQKGKASRRNVVLGVMLLISTLITAVIVRERSIGSELGGLARENPEDLSSMRTRVAGLQGVLTDRRAWFGMYGTMSEISRLEGEIAKLEEEEARERREAARLEEQRGDLAEAARERGLMLARRGDFDAALRDLRHSLELTTDDWEHRQRVLSDVAAIERFRMENE